MGNCVFRGGSKIIYDKDEDLMIRVVTPNGGVMELHPPIMADFITNEFPGHAIYHGCRHSSPPLLHHEDLLPGNIYYLLPLSVDTARPPAAQTTPYRMSFGSNARKTPAALGFHRGGVWKVRLVISPEQLSEILAQDVKTEALIESVRTVAKCGGHGGSSAGAYSAADSDEWSVTSSWKGLPAGKSGHEDI